MLRPDSRTLPLRARDVGVVDQLVVDRGDGVLPRLRLGHPRAEVARDGAHVAVQQLVPGLGEGLRQLVGVLEEPARDRLVDGVHPQRQVAREHHRRVAHRTVVGIGHRIGAGAVLRLPLLGAGRALTELPLVAEQRLEVAVVPLDRRGRPGALEAARDGVLALAAAEAALPAETLVLDRATLGLGSDQVGIACAVALAEGVTTGDERNGLLVVHRHAGEGLTDVPRRRQGIWVAVRTLGVHVDQAHLHRTERPGQLAVTAVALVAQPGVLGAPEDLLGLVDVFASERESEGLEAHRLEGAVAGQHQQVGPRHLAAVLLLDRPEQTAGLVEVGVVGPAVEGGEALRAVARATAAVGDPVGAGGVPRQPDEQRPVVAVVGGPPVLRGGHDLEDVLLQRLDIEGGDLCGVVEVVVHRVGLWRMPMEHVEIELVGPPVAIRSGPRRPLRGGGGDRRVLALATGVRHGGSPRSVVGTWRCSVLTSLVARRSRGSSPSR